MRKSNYKCDICKKEMYARPNRIKTNKNGITCSKACGSILKSQYMSGEGNHQYGLIGDKNSSHKGLETISNLGYILEYCPGHPRPHDKGVLGSRVRQHRLVIERNSHQYNKDYFEILNGWVVLKKEYDVHHINEIKTDNTLGNLEIITRSKHTSLHNKDKTIIRDPLGRIIGVVKNCELLETPEDINTTT